MTVPAPALKRRRATAFARNDLRLVLGKLEREMARAAPRAAKISEFNAEIKKLKADIELQRVLDEEDGDDEA